eukprot:ctg_3743.g616
MDGVVYVFPRGRGATAGQRQHGHHGVRRAGGGVHGHRAAAPPEPRPGVSGGRRWRFRDGASGVGHGAAERRAQLGGGGAAQRHHGAGALWQRHLHRRRGRAAGPGGGGAGVSDGICAGAAPARSGIGRGGGTASFGWTARFVLHRSGGEPGAQGRIRYRGVGAGAGVAGGG